jgi:hypothetical protein
VAIEDRIKAGLYVELQRNYAIGMTQKRHVGALSSDVIAKNPILLWVYTIGVDAGLRNALTMVDYAKLAEILSYSDGPVYGGDRAIP